MVTLVGMVRDHLVNSDFSEGCPIATVALEAATSEPLQRTCSKAFETWTVLFVERLVAEGYTHVQAGERVLIALTMMEGGLLLGRAHRSTRPLDAVSSEIRRVLEIQEIP
jgi:TetR/AcrR family transcriptional repressor of lmrAB and yxaGH operons